MTDNDTTETAEQIDARLLSIGRRIAAGELLDVVDEVRGLPNAAAIGEALLGLITERDRWVNRNGNPQVGERMALVKLHQVTAAIDAGRHPFERQADLDAALLALTDAEQAAADALAELNAAVKAGDVTEVMRLRGEVEVGSPRKIGEARKQLLRLQVEQAEAAAGPAKQRAVEAHRRVEARKEELAKLVRQIEQARHDVDAAAIEAAACDQGSAILAEQVGQRRTELTTLETSHDREMEQRLRRIAGLDASEAPAAPTTARRIQAPVVDLSPSESTVPAPMITN